MRRFTNGILVAQALVQVDPAFFAPALESVASLPASDSEQWTWLARFRNSEARGADV